MKIERSNLWTELRGENNIFVIFMVATKFTEKLHIYAHTCAGTVESDLLCVIGCSVGSGLQDQMNCNDTEERIPVRKGSSVQAA